MDLSLTAAKKILQGINTPKTLTAHINRYIEYNILLRMHDITIQNLENGHDFHMAATIHGRLIL